MKKVLVTGGAGYKGCVLVPKLLAAGYGVVVYDLMLFGSAGLPSHPHLKVVTGDIRDAARYADAVTGCDHVIHMACISNDPSFDLDPSLSRTINYECFEPLVLASKSAGVKRFVYVSSSSVYGVSKSPEVTEDHPLVPLTDYNKYKGLCEPILFQHQSPEFICVTVRPATVCGYSPRMRFDLTVNILTNHAYNKGIITIFGGNQQRPNIHIDDVCELYVELLTMPAEKIAGEIFNAGYQNQTVNELAEIPKQIVEEDHADVLVASLTSDSHINKANFRPFVPQDLRAMNLAAHECVDYVIIDDNETPIENLKVIQPDFFRERLRVFC
jgi:nucleoside-diphosphate-sugar epimerase